MGGLLILFSLLVFSGIGSYVSGRWKLTPRATIAVASAAIISLVVAFAAFSQPLFDLRLIEICAEQLAGHEVYWGVAPVLRAGSRRYWEVKNRAFFPADFEPTQKWNQRFAREALAWVRERGTHLYFMPIRADLGSYLAGFLD